MPELARDGITLHYEVDGTGPPLLLHAGMLSDSASWTPLVPRLADRFTVIRPDNRTTGRTRPADVPNGAAEMAGDALALMDHLGHDRFHVAGHSMGGLMAMELAHLAPGRVATVGVLASGRVRSPRTTAVFDALLAVRRGPRGEELWLRALFPWLFGPAFFEAARNLEDALAASLAYPHAQTADAMARQIEMFRNFRPVADPATLACPTLVIYAGQDLLIPPALARPGFRRVPDLTEVTVEAAGHSVVWDAPDAVADAMRAFLSRHPA